MINNGALLSLPPRKQNVLSTVINGTRSICGFYAIHRRKQADLDAFGK